MRVADEIRMINLTVSATGETRFKSTCRFNCPYGVIMKKTPFYGRNVSIIATVISDTFSLSQIPQLEFEIGATTQAEVVALLLTKLNRFHSIGMATDF